MATSAQTRSNPIFIHADQSSIVRAELTITRRTVQLAESSFRKHLCNFADDARPVEDGSADQNHIFIAAVARELHGDKLTFWVWTGSPHSNTPTHTCVAAQ